MAETKEIRIVNHASGGSKKRTYKITLVYEGTHTEGTTIYAKYQMPIKLAETYSAGTAYVIAKAMQELYRTAEYADYIEIK